MKTRDAFIGLLLAIILGWSYFPSIVELVQVWQSDPDYQHGFIVIPLAIAIAARRWHLIPKEVKPSWLGLVLLAVAGSVRIVAARFYYTELDAWSIPIWLLGCTCLFGGTKMAYWGPPSDRLFVLHGSVA